VGGLSGLDQESMLGKLGEEGRELWASGQLGLVLRVSYILPNYLISLVYNTISSQVMLSCSMLYMPMQISIYIPSLLPAASPSILGYSNTHPVQYDF
jgi:hypothetical protein